ncbi:MAG: hypothetical protein JXR63_03100 [Spirochaetales bacterium]|nr:hypothetical protein [Spirochaetales bacterium]
MKKIIFAIMLMASVSVFAENQIPEFLHLKTDLAFNLGNTSWPAPGLGFSTHTRLGFDIWSNNVASGSLETGFVFAFQGDPLLSLSTFGAGVSGDSGEIEFSNLNLINTLQWSFGHTFYFLEKRNLFLSLYSFLGYSWRINSITDITNNSSLELAADELTRTVGAFTSSFSVQLGYNFHENVGVFAYGNYIVPVEPGVHGNYSLGFGLSFTAF